MTVPIGDPGGYGYVYVDDDGDREEDGGSGGKGGGDGGSKARAVTRVRDRRRRATQQRRSDVDVDEDEDEDEAAAEDRRVDGYAERDYGWHGVGRSRATVFEKSAPRTNRVTRDAEPRSCVVESRSAGLRSSAPSSAAKKRE